MSFESGEKGAKPWQGKAIRLLPISERVRPDPDWAERTFDRAIGWCSPYYSRVSRKDFTFAAEVLNTAPSQAEVADISRSLRADGLRGPALVAAMALAVRAAQDHLGLTPYPVQIIGAQSLLRGNLIEMHTGEGKTLTAFLAACVAGLAGQKVHVVTVNDYLAARDGKGLASAYAALGLRCAAITHEVEQTGRQAAYRADIVYISNKELTFDYLRDKARLGGRRSRPSIQINNLLGIGRWAPIVQSLDFAIVDEADSVLVDEARTPLILSEMVEGDLQRNVLIRALEIADGLVEGRHYQVHTDERRVELSRTGEQRISEQADGLEGYWKARKAREELVIQALTARHLYNRDRDYIVKDGTVQIVDEFTGRAMPDRQWQRGLHQLIELTEELSGDGARRTLAQMTYQRFFRRYVRVAGMTGTGREVASDFYAVYRMTTRRIPTHLPTDRAYSGITITDDVTQKMAMIVRRCIQIVTEGRPILIGTRSVEMSEALAEQIRSAGLEVTVLNARQDADEAEIIGRAGQAGRITVATNMAGRGTDITLPSTVKQAGGLHVILTEFHESRRIDRQLYGRTGRQGDPGSCEAIVAFDDEIFERFATRLQILSQQLLKLPHSSLLRPYLAGVIKYWAQTKAERQNARSRHQLFKQSRKLENAMAFAGRAE